MALLGLFSSESQVTNSTSVSSYENSFNTSNSSSSVVSEAGNVTLNIDRESAVQKAMPAVVLAVIALVVLVSIRGK